MMKVISESKRAVRTKLDNYHRVDTSAGGLLVPEGIIQTVVSVSILTWFIRYINFFKYTVST